MRTVVFCITSMMISFFSTIAYTYADENQNLAIMDNVVLIPGDVINFTGGGGAVIGVGDYGHTGMYLGIDPVTKEKVFLDFTTNKTGPFRGRISNEEKFLSDNTKHEEFNVYRLNGNYSLNQQKLMIAAKDISTNKNFGAMIDCANAASRALSAAAGVPIIQVRPDGFADDDRFTPTSVSVNVKAALSEVREGPAGKIDGTWTGTLSSSDSSSFDAVLHISNINSGTADFASGSCGGNFSGGNVGGTQYSYHLSITYGRRTSVEEAGCVDGTMTLILNEGVVSYSWHGVDVDGSPISSSGVLYKE